MKSEGLTRGLGRADVERLHRQNKLHIGRRQRAGRLVEAVFRYAIGKINLRVHVSRQTAYYRWSP